MPRPAATSTDQTDVSSKQRLISIQILRAVAASMVLVYHLFSVYQIYGLLPERHFLAGAAGVDIFVTSCSSG